MLRRLVLCRLGSGQAGSPGMCGGSGSWPAPVVLTPTASHILTHQQGQAGTQLVVKAQRGLQLPHAAAPFVQPARQARRL